MKVLNRIVILALAFTLFSCSKKEETATTETKTVEPAITFVPGKILRLEASSEATLITSEVIKNEINEVVKDGTIFVITSTEGPLISADNTTFSESIEVSTVGGRFSFFSQTPTTVGSYRIEAKPKKYDTVGRFFLQVNPSSTISSIGAITSSRYEDLNLNGVKDPGEEYSFLADGLSAAYVIVGPVADEFGNPVEEGRIQISTDRGLIISENPANLSDGYAHIRLESGTAPGPANISAWAIDSTDTEIAGTRITNQIPFVIPELTFSGNLDFEHVFIGQRVERQITIRNSGTSRVSSMSYSISSPFVMVNKGACDGKDFLLPSEECILTVSFEPTINELYTGSIQIFGTPSSIPGTSASISLQAQGANPPEIRVDNSSINFGNVSCGETATLELVVSNLGDFPAQNLQVVNPGPHTGQTTSFFTLTLPPEDPNPSPNLDDVIDCGTRVPGNRKCRILMEFHPTALVANDPLQASISVDGQAPILITMRGVSTPSSASGSPNIAFFNPDDGTPITSIGLDLLAEAEVRVGPLQDSCGNDVLNGTVIDATVSAGSLIATQSATNNGLATFLWRGSNAVADIGPQTINITSGGASASEQITFSGINLEVVGPTEAGQILTVAPQDFTYTITNSGNVVADNLHIRVDNLLGENPFSVESLGNCSDLKLLPLESCDVVVRGNVATFITVPAPFETTFKADTNGLGNTSYSSTLNGNAEYPPTLQFSSNLYNVGSGEAGGTLPTTRVTLSNISPADALDLNLLINSPFTITNSTCGTDLLANQDCEFDLNLDSTTSANYNEILKATSEYSQTQTSATGFISPTKASGIIPMSLNVPSVAANKVDEIEISVGPVKDQYDNLVLLGTPVIVSADKGLLSLDSNQNGTAETTTDANGMVALTIKAKEFSDVSNFVIHSRVYESDGITISAQGSANAQFTGALLSFVQSNVNYGSVPVGTLELRTITLQNTGNESATNIILNSSNTDYIITSVGGCTGALTTGATLAPSASCDISIAFFPNVSANITAIIQVTADGNGVVENTINLTGLGFIPATLVAGIDEIFSSLSPGVPFSSSFTVENVGGEPVSNFQVSASSNASDFTFDFSTCTNLAALSSCTVSYTFNPSVATPIQTTITVSGDRGIGTTSDTISFTSQPAQIQYHTIPFNLSQGDCGEIKIQSIDFSSVPTQALANIPLSLNSTIGGFFSDSACTTSISSTNIPMGATETPSIYFKSDTSGQAEVSASSSNLLAESSITVFAPLSVIPQNNSVYFMANADKYFTANGGLPPYTWQLLSYSGISVVGLSSDTSVYTLHNTLASGAYSMKVTDSLGNIAYQIGYKMAEMVITPATSDIKSNSASSISVSGGEAPYTYSLTTDGGIGSSVSSSGVFNSGSHLSSTSPITEVVSITDNAGNVKTAIFNVEPDVFGLYKIFTLPQNTQINLEGQIAIDGDTIALGNSKRTYYGVPSDPLEPGDVRIYEHNGGVNSNFTEEQIITTTGNDNLCGRGVSLDANQLLFGCPGSSNSFLYRKIGVNYTQNHIFTPPASQSHFGKSVYLQGNNALIFGNANISSSTWTSFAYKKTLWGFGWGFENIVDSPAINFRYFKTRNSQNVDIVFRRSRSSSVLYVEKSTLAGLSQHLPPMPFSNDIRGFDASGDVFATRTNVGTGNISVFRHVGSNYSLQETITGGSIYFGEKITIDGKFLITIENPGHLKIYESANGYSGWVARESIAPPAGCGYNNFKMRGKYLVAIAPCGPSSGPKVVMFRLLR